MNNDKVFNLFANCIPIKGSIRSIIYDLERSTYSFIPNGLYEILTENAHKTLQELKDYYKDYGEIIDEYFDFLEKNEFIFWSSKKESQLFPSLNLEWDYPGKITNSVLIINNQLNLDIDNILQQLFKLGCYNYSIFCTSSYELSILTKIVNRIKDYPLKSVSLYMPFNSKINYTELINSTYSKLKFQKAVIYACNQDNVTKSKNGLIGNIYFTRSLHPFDSKAIHKEFMINTSFFTESLKYNTFYNRKLIVNTSGYITNSLQEIHQKWDTKNINIENLITLREFNHQWFLKKDQINVCKDCEYRYMCSDPREIKQISDNEFEYSSDCGYNPYLGKWNNEEGYITAVESLKINTSQSNN